jgi:hypothetical protein
VSRDEASGLFRVVEDNGELVDCWLPGHEDPVQEGALDAGGFLEWLDALGFSLGVTWERAHRGLLGDLTTVDVDVLRGELDYPAKTSEPRTDV